MTVHSGRYIGTPAPVQHRNTAVGQLPRLSPSRFNAALVAFDEVCAQISIVTEICACRRICITSRGCTSRSTSSVAHVRRPSCTVIFRTPALRHRLSQARWKLCDSIGVPHFVEKTQSPSCHAPPAGCRAAVCSSRRSRNAAAQISTNGSQKSTSFQTRPSASPLRRPSTRIST